jgi:hypothetical protein
MIRHLKIYGKLLVLRFVIAILLMAFALSGYVIPVRSAAAAGVAETLNIQAVSASFGDTSLSVQTLQHYPNPTVDR